MIYRFRRKGQSDPDKDKSPVVDDSTPPYPENAGAMTAAEYFQYYTPEVPRPAGTPVRENGAEVFYQWDRSGHRWWGWRFATQVRAGLHPGYKVAERDVKPTAKVAHDRYYNDPGVR